MLSQVWKDANIEMTRLYEFYIWGEKISRKKIFLTTFIQVILKIKLRLKIYGFKSRKTKKPVKIKLVTRIIFEWMWKEKGKVLHHNRHIFLGPVLKSQWGFFKGKINELTRCHKFLNVAEYRVRKSWGLFCPKDLNFRLGKASRRWVRRGKNPISCRTENWECRYSFL